MKVYFANGPLAGTVGELPDFKIHEIDGVQYQASRVAQSVTYGKFHAQVFIDVASVYGEAIIKPETEEAELSLMVNLLDGFPVSEMERIPV